MIENLTRIGDASKENKTGEKIQLENRLFILKPVPQEITLPCALETGECVSTDGRWVKVMHKDKQTFYRCARRFELSVGVCFVGRQLPFFEKHRNLNGVILLLVGSLSVALGAHFLWESAGSASSFRTQSKDSIHKNVESKILQDSDVLNVNHAAAAFQESSSQTDPPVASHTSSGANAKPSSAEEPELDPLRCAPLRSEGAQRPPSQRKVNVQSNERTWYVCR